MNAESYILLSDAKMVYSGLRHSEPLPLAKTPTGIYMHVLGDHALASQKPSYSQTLPVRACGVDNFTIDGQLINLQTGMGVGGATIEIISFDFTTCTWQVLTTVTTDFGEY